MKRSRLETLVLVAGFLLLVAVLLIVLLLSSPLIGNVYSNVVVSSGSATPTTALPEQETQRAANVFLTETALAVIPTNLTQIADLTLAAPTPIVSRRTLTPTDTTVGDSPTEMIAPVSINLNAINFSEVGENLLLDVQLNEEEQVTQFRVDVIDANNNVVAQSYEASPNGSIELSTSGLPEGEYTVQVSALDSDGNVIAADTAQANIGAPEVESTEEPMSDFPSDTPTPLATASPTPQEVAAAFFVVRDVSGGVIGQGTLRIFAPQQIPYPQTARVELELHIDSRYITPTPVPRDGPVGGDNQPTRTPSSTRPTPTPREAVFEQGGLDVYQRMGASLICAEQSFSGCDSEQANPIDARLININGITWSWIIAPTEGIRGLQDLEVRVWKLISVNEGAPEAEIVWTHGFQINVLAAGTVQPAAPPPLLLLAIGAGVLVLVVGFGVALKLARRNPLAAPAGDRPKVFISYRRKSTFADAWFVSQELQKAGADVFIDVDDIHEGRFAEIIEKAIRERDYFVPVLAPDTLDSEWVRKEIAFAIQNKRKIVPVMVRGFTFDKPLPDDVRELQSYNAVTITPEFVRAGIEKLLSFIGLKV